MINNPMKKTLTYFIPLLLLVVAFVFAKAFFTMGREDARNVIIEKVR